MTPRPSTALQTAPNLDAMRQRGREGCAKTVTTRKTAQIMADSEHTPLVHHLQRDEPGRLRDLADSVEIVHARAWDTEDRLSLEEDREARDHLSSAMQHLDEAMAALRSAARAAE